MLSASTQHESSGIARTGRFCSLQLVLLLLSATGIRESAGARGPIEYETAASTDASVQMRGSPKRKPLELIIAPIPVELEQLSALEHNASKLVPQTTELERRQEALAADEAALANEKQALAAEEAKTAAATKATHTAHEDAPFIDAFFFCYWGTAVILFFGAIVGTSHWAVLIAKEKEKEAEEKQVKSAEDEEEEEVLEEDEEKTIELSENMWALNLVAALGQVQFGNGEQCSAYIVFAISLFMGLLQLAAVALMVNAIDPNALPVTVVPGSPWLADSSPLPINLMKWFMVIFLTVGQVGEVAQCRSLVTQSLLVNPNMLQVSRALPLAAAVLQYTVSISVVWAGCAVILCFQTVPDIVYSSMTVFFITGADEMFYECIQTIFDLDADWTIGAPTGSPSSPRRTPRLPAAPPAAGDPPPVGDKPTSFAIGKGFSALLHQSSSLLTGTDKPMFKEKELPCQVWWALKALQLFPMAFGFFVLSRAFYTGVMPTKRFHVSGMW